MNLKTYFSALCLLACIHLGVAQITDDLEIIPMYEMNFVGQHISMENDQFTYKSNPIAIYNKEGVGITFAEFSEAMQQMKFGVDFYRKKGEKDIVAAQLRDLNTMELQMQKEQEEMMKNSPVGEGKDVPDFELKDMEGKVYSKSSLAGKTVVFNTWFIKCKPCVEEMPELNELVHKYKGNDKIVFLAVTFDTKASVEEFLKEQTLDYAIVTDASSFLQEINIMGYPTNYVVDESGIVLFNGVGYNPDNIKKIDKILAKL